MTTENDAKNLIVNGQIVALEIAIEKFKEIKYETKLSEIAKLLIEVDEQIHKVGRRNNSLRTIGSNLRAEHKSNF